MAVNENPAAITDNGQALKALGNSNPPWVTFVIGRAIMRVDAELSEKR
jgi:hypothetical protein